MTLDDIIRQEEQKQQALIDCTTANDALEAAKLARSKAIYDAKQAGCTVFDISIAAKVSTVRIYQVVRQYGATTSVEASMSDAEWRASLNSKAKTSE